MGYKYAEIAFTDTVKALQEQLGSRAMYARQEADGDRDWMIGTRETAFIAARDSFYMASVSETGWPYLQHRGGPTGFLKVLDEQTLGFADYTGNRQYISTGNLMTDDRVSLILMDYPNKARMKLLGRVEIISMADTETLQKLVVPDYRARIERGFRIRLEAIDWNCPQHITPRFTVAETEAITLTLAQRIAELEAEVVRLGGSGSN